MAIDNQNKRIPFNIKSRIIKPQTLAEGEKEELIEFFPNEDLEYLQQVHWDSFNKMQHPVQFHICLNNKSKKIQVQFFEDSILELSGDGLKQLDSHVFYLAICPFVKDVFECDNLK